MWGLSFAALLAKAKGRLAQKETAAIAVQEKAITTMKATGAAKP